MAIENPNLQIARARAEAVVREALADEAPDFLTKGGPKIKVKRFTKYDDPGRFDRQFESVVKEIETSVVNIDAKMVEGNRIVHYRNAKEFLKSPTVIRRINEARAQGRFSKEEADRAQDAIRRRSLQQTMKLRTLKEGDAFEMGLYPDEVGWNAGGRYQATFPVSDIILPSLNSPQSKNALWVDYLDAHRKSFEAATFNPIAKRITKIIPQFVLGRGVVGSIDSRKHQDAWDEFYKLNRMRMRTKQMLRELIIFGEVFWRFFASNGSLVVRSIDPSTIWDIVTDPDDIEDVRYYHQQYVRLDQSPVPGHVPIPSTVVIRQIPADQIDHYKINSTSSEKRGRSELFPILGYLLRYKEFLDDRIKINKMRGMFALDVAVDGGEPDVSAAEAQFAVPPGPAAVLVHNKAVEIEFKNTNANASDAETDAESILKVIAIGAGVSEQFLGVARAQTRAGALISTEPDVKNFEDYQELVEEVLMTTSDRLFKYKRLEVKTMEFTFPAIAQEDRSTKIKDIAFSESMDYFSKRRAATMVAREFQITDYGYDDEQQTIKEERKENPVISQSLVQVDKVAPMGAGAAPGLGPDLKVGADNPLGDTKQGVTQTSAQMGFPDNLGGRSLSDTQATLNRPGFTRGGEKTAIKNNRTSGTPLRHSVEGPVKRGWSAEARAKSLLVRRQNAQKRKQGSE